MTNFFTDLASVVEPVDIHFLWRPTLTDAADEMVLEAAVNGQADVLATFNSKHFAKRGLSILRRAGTQPPRAGDERG